jgi:hypothetical protein
MAVAEFGLIDSLNYLFLLSYVAWRRHIGGFCFRPTEFQILVVLGIFENAF